MKARALEALGEADEAAKVLAAYFAVVTPLGLHADAGTLRIRLEAAAPPAAGDDAADGDAAAGEVGDGEAEGEAADGEAADGETVEGEAAEGEAAEGEAVEAEAAEGEVAEGEAVEAEAVDDGAAEAAAEAEALAAREAARTAKVQSADFDEAGITVRLFDDPDFLPLPSGGALMVTPGERVLRIEGEYGRVDLPVTVAGGRGRRAGASVSPAALAPAALLVAGLPAGAVVSISQKGPSGIVIEELYATSARYEDVHPSGIPVVPPQTIGDLVGAPATVSVRHHKYGSSEQQATLKAGAVARITFDPYSLPKQPDAELAASTIKAAEDAKLNARVAEAAAAEALVGPPPEQEQPKKEPAPVVRLLPTIALAGAGALLGGVFMGGAAGQATAAAGHRDEAEAAAFAGDELAFTQAQELHDAARQAETGLFAGSLAATGTAVAGLVVTVVLDQKRKAQAAALKASAVADAE